jgi:beta-galactosidase
MKDLPKGQHLAWNVRYSPGTIEARGYKDGRQVMTAKRETTGPATTLAMRTDRQEIAADGEDVVVCAVEVLDAQGRVLPTTGQQVSFSVNGPGSVIGVGNGDPTATNRTPTTRKAFSSTAWPSCRRRDRREPHRRRRRPV